jgi:hypothetical protein
VRRDTVVAVLAAHREELRKFGVRDLRLFGSFARDEAREDSDVDLLVEFDGPVGLFAYVRLQHQLATWLGRAVDLVTPGGLKPALRDRILREAVRAA